MTDLEHKVEDEVKIDETCCCCFNLKCGMTTLAVFQFFFVAQCVKVHYINVDYLSSEGATAGVDLLFTDKVAE